MTSALWAVALLLLTLTSCATIPAPAPQATITYRGTAPLQDNVGTCAAPSYRPATSPMTIHWDWTGAPRGRDSLTASPGDTIRLKIHAGAISMRHWGTRGRVSGCTTLVLVGAAR